MIEDRAANREAAIQKVAKFLQDNYPCSFDCKTQDHHEEDSDLNEAAAIVELVEAAFYPDEVRCRHCGDPIYQVANLARWRHTNGMYTCTVPQRPRPRAAP